MGERHSGDGTSGRRRAHPGGARSAPDHTHGDPAFEARLGAALRGGGVDAEAERRAVAAFRAARETTAPRARTRRRDDWRPAAPGRARLSWKAALSVTLASLTLGGVAVAAIGSAASGHRGHPDTPRPARPSTSVSLPPAAPGASTGTGGGGSGTPSPRPHHPATARDTVAHCRTYERAGRRGGALDSTAWRRLVAEAGGENNVAAYCAAAVAHATTGNGQNQGKIGKSGKSNANSGTSNGTSKPTPTAGAPKAKATNGR
ncbi:hypothetical protein [Streptomyces sp. NBC_00557]|uniref:hypothetical protein n=1 Tax=Streptomyces sp. NBC_00557 TaxID=2975776 RepID=UPI002E8083DF|nr:hypothetical protein [Streptomyces sp. NBC_00557]WUC35129.1 hypothetical protein OG956_13315 [Streptomyces sp. NBC_00557]